MSTGDPVRCPFGCFPICLEQDLHWKEALNGPEIFLKNESQIFTGDEDIDELLRECLKLFKSKGDDYTQGTGDRLHNFKTVAQFTGNSPESVLGVYLYKHLSAIYSYIKSGGQSESEPIEGRIADAVNYLLLLKKMISVSKRENAPKESP